MHFEFYTRESRCEYWHYHVVVQSELDHRELENCKFVNSKLDSHQLDGRELVGRELESCERESYKRVSREHDEDWLPVQIIVTIREN